MAKDPAFLFYPSDWMGGTMLLTRHQKGCYIDLLIAQFNNGPLTLEQIKISLGQDQAQWTVLQDKFIKDSSGRFFNKKLATEVEKRKSFIARQQENGQKGGRPKNPRVNPWDNPNHNPNETLSFSSSSSNNKSNVSGEKKVVAKATTNKLEERKLKFGKSLEEFKDKYSRETLTAFYKYWTEKNQTGKKMRFELQKTFETNLRLSTWASRENSFKPKDQPVKSPKIVKV